jgi:hypothetical protein
VRRADDHTIVGHGGGCPGYITSFSMLPKHKLAAVVLTNAGDGPAGRLAVNILKAIGPALQAAATPPAEEAPDLSRYEGNYDSRPWGGEVAVRQRGAELVVVELPADDLKEATTRLEHDSGDTFVRLTDDGERREPWLFELDAEGRAFRIVRHSSHLNRIAE